MSSEIELVEESLPNVVDAAAVSQDVVTCTKSESESDTSSSESKGNVLFKRGIIRSLSYRVQWFLFRLHVMAICGGVTIGYIPTTISGVLAMEGFLKLFSDSTYVSMKQSRDNNYCSYVSTWIQLYVAVLPTIVVLSYALAIWNSTKRGNKNTFVFATLFLFLGVVFIQHSPSVSFQVTSNILLGFGIGFLYQATPRLLSELAPKEFKTRLSLIFSCSNSLGSAMAAGINWRTSLAYDGWKVAYFLLFIPIFVLLCFGSLFLEKTPIWLVEKHKEEEAQAKLRKMRGTLDIESEFKSIKKLVTRKETKKPWRYVFGYMSRPALVVSIAFSVFPSLLGFSIFTNYGPLLLQSIKVEVPGDAFLATFIANFVALIAACLNPIIFLKFGRRIVFIGSSLIMIGTMVVAFIIFQLSITNYSYFERYQVYLTGSVFGLYIICQTIIFGPAGALEVSYPKSTEAVGNMLGNSISLFLNSVLSFYFVRLLCSIQQYVFIFYCGLNLLLLSFIWWFLPETMKAKARTVLRGVWGKHWFWAYYVKGVGKVYF